ncbi:MAG: hypothetical protein EBS48_10995, partial [Actinobacteria bacterium]|nr:hypothetical protein [Actinomycetota bacterium]
MVRTKQTPRLGTGRSLPRGLRRHWSPLVISLVFGDSAPGLLHLLAEPGGAVMVLAHPGGAAGECFSLLELAIMAGSGSVASAIIAELGGGGGGGDSGDSSGGGDTVPWLTEKARFLPGLAHGSFERVLEPRTSAGMAATLQVRLAGSWLSCVPAAGSAV